MIFDLFRNPVYLLVSLNWRRCHLKILFLSLLTQSIIFVSCFPYSFPLCLNFIINHCFKSDFIDLAKYLSSCVNISNFVSLTNRYFIINNLINFFDYRLSWVAEFLLNLSLIDLCWIISLVPFNLLYCYLLAMNFMLNLRQLLGLALGANYF